jgi:predicted HAD superfamily phosphohydrolase YqeG
MELLDERQVSGSTVILDIDGTITADAKTQIPPRVQQAIRRLASRNAVYMFSNHRDGLRNRRIALSMGLRYLDTHHRKPSRRIVDAIPAEHRIQPLVVIGDKIVVDGLFAWRIGARFIKVDRVVSASDRRLVRLTYFLDDVISNLAAFWRNEAPRRRQQRDCDLRCPSSDEICEKEH